MSECWLYEAVGLREPPVAHIVDCHLEYPLDRVVVRDLVHGFRARYSRDDVPGSCDGATL